MTYNHSLSDHDGRYDSYFVDNHVDESSVLHAQECSHVQNARRIQQRATAKSLSIKAAIQYSDDTRRHMEDIESWTTPDARLLEALDDALWTGRHILLEYLMEVHTAYRLRPESLFLAVNLLDRYCCRQAVGKNQYQLLGCIALLIAAKYGDNSTCHVATLKDLRSAFCLLYNTARVREMEWNILQVLEWTVGHPDVPTFLHIALLDGPDDAVLRHSSMYIAEIALFYKEFASVKPSILSRSALAVARYVLSQMPLEPTGWAHNYDTQTFIRLFHHLYQPPRVIFCKYAVRQLSSASSVVNEFLQRPITVGMQPGAAIEKVHLTSSDRKTMHQLRRVREKGYSATDGRQGRTCGLRRTR